MNFIGGATPTSQPGFSAKHHSAAAGQAYLPTVVAAALLLAAPAFALTSWLFAADRPVLLFYSTPVIMAEIAVIILAIAAGFDIRITFARLHPITRVGAAIWLAAVLFADLIAAPVEAAAIPLLFTTLVHAIFALALWSLVTTAWASHRNSFLICSAAGVGLFGLIFVSIILTEVGNPNFHWIGVGIGITNIRQLGFYGITLVGITLGFAVSAHGWRMAIVASGLTFGFWLTILSGSRVAFTAALLVAFAVGISSESRSRTSLAALVAIALAVAVPTSYLLVPHEAWGFDRIIARSLSGGSLNEYTSGRLAIWQETWSAILQSPFLGHGEGQFRSQIASAGNGLNQPHNAVLQFLYQWGLIGTVGLTLMLVSTLRNLGAAMRRRTEADLAAIGAATGLLAAAMLDGSLYYVHPVMIVVLCLVTLHAPATGRRPETGASAVERGAQLPKARSP